MVRGVPADLYRDGEARQWLNWYRFRCRCCCGAPFSNIEREGKIFDLPANKFFRGIPGLDLSVDFHGHRAATPLGPAAGPHGQLAQNIALSWLGGSRIIELKTVQILDELKIPRPCIDAANVGYNVEWSQELRLEQSLREYVKAAMLLEILKLQVPGRRFRLRSWWTSYEPSST